MKLDNIIDFFFDLLERVAIVALVALIVLALPGFWGVAMYCDGGVFEHVLGYSLFTVSVTTVYAVARTLLTEISYTGVSPFIL